MIGHLSERVISKVRSTRIRGADPCSPRQMLISQQPSSLQRPSRSLSAILTTQPAAAEVVTLLLVAVVLIRPYVEQLGQCRKRCVEVVPIESIDEIGVGAEAPRYLPVPLIWRKAHQSRRGGRLGIETQQFSDCTRTTRGYAFLLCSSLSPTLTT